MAKVASTTQKLNQYLADSKNKSYFVTAVTVAFIVLLATVGIIPALSAVGQQREENKKRDEVIAQMEDKLNVLKKLVTEQSEKAIFINYLNQNFPDSFNQSNFLEIIIDAATKTGVSLQQISYADTPSELNLREKYKVSEQVKVGTVTLGIDGSQSALGSFINTLESSRLIINVESISISKKVGSEFLDSTNENEYRCTLTLNYFYYAQPGS